MSHAQTRRRCIFCKGPAGSSEHAWPDWLNGVFEPYVAVDAGSGWTQRSADLDGIRWERTFPKRRFANLTTKLVCHDCNTGWMAELEEAAKTILEPMVTGKRIILSMPEQLVVAHWAVKTVAVLKTTFTDSEQFSDVELDILKNERRVPVSTQVVLAAVTGAGNHLAYAEVGFPQIDNLPGSYLRFATLQLGTLVLQVIWCSPLPKDHDALTKFHVPPELEVESGVAVSIAPPVDMATFPPHTVLQPESFIRFMRRNATVPEGWEIPSRYEGPEPRGGNSDRK